MPKLIQPPSTLAELAKEVSELRAEVLRLRTALEPLTKYRTHFEWMDAMKKERDNPTAHFAPIPEGRLESDLPF